MLPLRPLFSLSHISLSTLTLPQQAPMPERRGHRDGSTKQRCRRRRRWTRRQRCSGAEARPRRNRSSWRRHARREKKKNVNLCPIHKAATHIAGLHWGKRLSGSDREASWVLQWPALVGSKAFEAPGPKKTSNWDASKKSPGSRANRLRSTAQILTTSCSQTSPATRAMYNADLGDVGVGKRPR